MSHRPASGTHALFAGLALLLGMLATVSGAALADEPTLALSKDSGPPTTRISVSGTGFGATETVDLAFGGVDVAAVDTDANGALTGVRIRVPAGAKPGNHTFTARGRASDLVATARFLVQTDWPQYRGAPAHLGFNRYENVLKPANVDRLKLAWTFDTGDEILASPTVVDGVVYAASRMGALHALDAASGDELWSRPGGNYGSPAAEGGVVYAAQGEVFALDAATGDQLWSYGAPGDQFGGSPALLSGLLYVISTDTDAPGGRIVALDATTGALLWGRSLRGETWGAPAVADGAVVVPTGSGRVYSLDASTGEPQWVFRAPGYMVLSPAVVGDRVFIGGSEERLYALDASTGDLVWRSPRFGARTAPAVADGIVVEGTGYGNVEALRASNGTLVWRFHAGGGDVESDATVANGVVYVGSNGDRVYALHAATGRELWSFRTGKGIQSSPTVVNGMVYVGSKDGKVYAFGLG